MRKIFLFACWGLALSCQTGPIRSAWSRETDYNIYIDQPSLFYSIDRIRHRAAFMAQMQETARFYPPHRRAPEMSAAVGADVIRVTIQSCDEAVVSMEYYYRQGVLWKVKKSQDKYLIESVYTFSENRIVEDKSFFDEHGYPVLITQTVLSPEKPEGEVTVRFRSEEFERVFDAWLRAETGLIDCSWDYSRRR